MGRHDLALVEAVRKHPRLLELGRNLDEQQRAETFARDLATWLLGAPREDLAPLARVVTLVAKRELRDARRLCADHPLMAVEAAARATEALWPMLRGPLAPEPEEPKAKKDQAEADGAQEEGQGDQPGLAGGDSQPTDEEGDEAEEGQGGTAGAGGAAGEGEGGNPEGAEGEAESGEDGPEEGTDEDASAKSTAAESLLSELADLDGADDELQRLADALRAALSGEDQDDEAAVEAAAGALLGRVGESATEGALETSRVARHLQHFLPGVGWSSAPRELENGLLEQLHTLSLLLERLDELSRLADQLGRLEEASRRQGTQHGGGEEVVGVQLGGDVAYALPSELALLGDPDTEDLFYQRLLEHRLVSLELTGQGMGGSAAADEKGPVIACIDTSGSMEGAPELAAKALVLAICRKVLPRGRTVHLILFGGAGERTEVRLKRGRGGLEGLLDFLSASFRAGTDFDVPLERAVELLEETELQHADVLVVTDGLCRASPLVIERVNRVRERVGVRVWSVVLGNQDPGGVRPFSDEVLCMDPSNARTTAGWLSGIDVPTRR